MAQVLLIMDRPSAVIQQGQPPAQMAAWLLDVPADGTALGVAAAFASANQFPLGTIARVIDLSKITDPQAVQKFQLDSSWTAMP
jgi:hypothetical protein